MNCVQEQLHIVCNVQLGVLPGLAEPAIHGGLDFIVASPDDYTGVPVDASHLKLYFFMDLGHSTAAAWSHWNLCLLAEDILSSSWSAALIDLTCMLLLSANQHD